MLKRIAIQTLAILALVGPAFTEGTCSRGLKHGNRSRGLAQLKTLIMSRRCPQNHV